MKGKTAEDNSVEEGLVFVEHNEMSLLSMDQSEKKERLGLSVSKKGNLSIMK